MIIWKQQDLALSDLNNLSEGTMAATLGIQFTRIGDDYLEATMPVNKTTHQPYGLLHGGASAALAETIGSVGSYLLIDPEQQLCVGMEINCNHIRGKRSGCVIGRAQPIHVGATSHVWDIRISDENGKLICISRLTMAILKIRK